MVVAKRRKFFQHQIEAFEWCKSRRHIALFMEMRLGKTLVAIRWTESLRPRKVLVVSPLSVTYVWQEELLKEGLSSTLLIGTWEEKLETLQAQQVRWYITNYESLHILSSRGKEKKSLQISSPIAELPWDCVLLDESTAIKNPKALRTKLCRKVFKTTPHKGILTGLANPEGPENYFEQFAFLTGEFLGFDNYWKFRHGCYRQGHYAWEWIPDLGTLRRIKDEVLKRAFIMTRKRAGVGPKKIRERRYCFLPSKIRKVYNQLENDFVLGQSTTKWIVVVKVWLARLTGGQPEQVEYCSDHKLTELMELLQGELLKEQIVIWFRFNKELIRVHTALNTADIPNDFITGETHPSERVNVLKRFQNGNFRCLLAQIKCAKFGIDCSAASTAIYYSNDFSYETRRQSEDRIVNIQKKEPVLIIDLLTKDTVDEDVYVVLQEKGINDKIFLSRVIANLKKRNEKQGE